MNRSVSKRIELATVVFVAVCLLPAVYLAIIQPMRDGRSNPSDFPPPLDIRRITRAVFSPDIRVNLTPTPVTELRIKIDSNYQIRPVGAQTKLAQGTRLKETGVKAYANGIQLGPDYYAVSRLEFTASESPAIWINSHEYRGSVRIYRQRGGRLLAVNVLPLEDYVASVVNGEMPATFPMAARRAQAIVARTYALDQMRASRGHPQFDVYKDTRSQEYLGFQYISKTGRRLAGENKSSRRITADTAGVVCTYQDRLFRTYYSAVCGGKTITGRSVFADAAEPLKSVACQWCRDSKFYRWTRRISKSESSLALRRYFASKPAPFEGLTAINTLKNSAGQHPEFEASDGRHTYRLSGAALRRNVSASPLPSASFSVRDSGDELVFEGRGHGHGVGLCQWGARGLGLQGRNCIEILEYYYPGSSVIVLRQ